MKKAIGDIKYILETYPETRKNDHLLYVTYFEHFYKVSFTRSNFILFRKSFESVSRARRKVQELHPELIENEQYRMRQEEERKYKDYYTQMSFEDLGGE